MHTLRTLARNNRDEYMPLWPMLVMFTAGGIMLSIPKMFQIVEKQLSEVAGEED